MVKKTKEIVLLPNSVYLREEHLDSEAAPQDSLPGTQATSEGSHGIPFFVVIMVPETTVRL